MESKTTCPYSNVLSKLKLFGGVDESKAKGNKVEEGIKTSFDAEKGIGVEMNSGTESCPFRKDTIREDHKIRIEDAKNKIINKEKNSSNDKDLSDEEENQGSGGCPMMDKNTKKDPINKHFEAHYEIPRFGPFDFVFVMKGGLEHEEFLEKTKKIRSYPRHLRNTLFLQNQEKLSKLHEKEFPMVFFVYDDIKEKGNRLFRRKKYREAIEHYTYAYGLLKWIEFKDKKRQEDFIKKPSLDPILDEDILEKQVYLDDIKVEEDSFKACVVYLLFSLSYAYMELRHYSEAVDSLDECILIAEDKVPDLFFRRSQARAFNKFSSQREFELSMQDVEKAISLKDDPMYKEHKELLLKIIFDRNLKEKFMTERVLNSSKISFRRIKERNIDKNDVIYTKKNKDAQTQYKILKEMKNKYSLAIKFFTESKDEEQLELSYKEIDKFMQTFEEFKFFLRFSVEEIPIQIMDGLSEEEKLMLDDQTHVRLVDEFKYKICEDIFGSGDFNFELFQYALEKVFEEERKVEEEEERRIEESRPKVSLIDSIKKSAFMKYLTGGIMVLSIGSIGVHYYLYSSNSVGSFFK